MKWYPSKIDWWLVPLLCLPPVGAIAGFVGLALQGEVFALLSGFGIVLFVLCIYFGLVFPMRYGMDDTHLIVRFGICRQRIPLTDVIEVYPTSNPLSSPALSLDRLCVQFGQGFFKAVMISPVDRDHFLAEFAQKAGMKREGNRLVRAIST